MGVGADEFCDSIRVEGVPATRHYLARPLFEEDVIAKRQTYGKGGYPFSLADNYRMPVRADFPGLEDFLRRQIILSWNSRLTSREAEGVANAVGKVLSAIAGSTATNRVASERREAYSVH